MCGEAGREQLLYVTSSRFPADHRINSADPDSVGGTSMPSAFAVLRLITNSNLVDCTTGNSAGFAPLRMRPA
jgi:hypothetical protein